MVFINKKIHEIETEEAPGHSATLNQADANINNCKHDIFFFKETFSSCVCGDQNRYFQPERDV